MIKEFFLWLPVVAPQVFCLRICLAIYLQTKPIFWASETVLIVATTVHVSGCCVAVFGTLPEPRSRTINDTQSLASPNEHPAAFSAAQADIQSVGEESAIG
jgi:hypothetical protein